MFQCDRRNRHYLRLLQLNSNGSEAATNTSHSHRTSDDEPTVRPRNSRLLPASVSCLSFNRWIREFHLGNYDENKKWLSQGCDNDDGHRDDIIHMWPEFMKTFMVLPACNECNKNLFLSAHCPVQPDYFFLTHHSFTNRALFKSIYGSQTTEDENKRLKNPKKFPNSILFLPQIKQHRTLLSATVPYWRVNKIWTVRCAYYLLIDEIYWRRERNEVRQSLKIRTFDLFSAPQQVQEFPRTIYKGMRRLTWIYFRHDCEKHTNLHSDCDSSIRYYCSFLTWIWFWMFQ